ncbi:MAG: VacJ family lipoprotein [Candidatus Puniceispirillaceae bacterium]
MPHYASNIRAFCKIMLIASFVAGCASLPEDQRSDIRDPYEETNRQVFAFNLAADTYVLEPVADGYRNVAPNGVQKAVSNHVNWVSLPSTAVNSTLQGKFENATLAVLHFAVNALTLGFADLTADDEQPTKEDFGQTLAAANVPEGSYIEVPLLGGHTTRSLTGRVVDFVMNPLSALQAGEVGQTVQSAQLPVAAVSARAEDFEAINEVKYNSLDPYARARSVYYQKRTGLLEDRLPGQIVESDNDDAFDSFFGD